MAYVIDDWFVEPPAPGPTRKHQAYHERLVAWGYLHRTGQLMWEVGPLTKMSDLLGEFYLPAIKADLNRTVFGGRDDWMYNPTARLM